MKKQVISLSLLVIVLVGLLAAMFLLQRRPPAGATTTLTQFGSYEVLRFDALVAEIAVIPRGGIGAYTVKSIPAGSGAAEQSSTLAGHEYLPVDTKKTDGLLSSARTLDASQLLYDEVDDYSLFGLADPMRIVRFTDLDGVTQTLLIGDSSPDGGNHYIQVQGNKTIYLIPNYRLSGYMQPETAYIDTRLVYGGADYYYAAQSITLGGSVRDSFGDILITPVTAAEATPMDLHTHMLRTPVVRPLDHRTGFQALLTLFTLEADEVLAIRPDAVMLSECGLDRPYSSVDVQSKGFGDFYLCVSEPDEMGMVYAYKDDIPLLYRINADKLPWMDMQFYDLMYRSVSTLYLDEIAEIEVATHMGDYCFVLDHSNPARIEVDMDGRPAHRENFMRLCETLRGASYDELTFDSLPDGILPELQITYRYVSGSPEKVMSFYPGVARRFIVDTGEVEFRFYTSSLYVDKVLSDVAAALPPG